MTEWGILFHQEVFGNDGMGYCSTRRSSEMTEWGILVHTVPSDLRK